MNNSSTMDEVGLIRNYLMKNHKYRTGELTSGHRMLLVHERDWQSWGTLYFDQVYSDVTVENEGNLRDLYYTSLTGNYEFIHVSVHSAATYHSFSHGKIYSTDIPTIDPTTFFYSL